jgi:hypothetical protein
MTIYLDYYDWLEVITGVEPQLMYNITGKFIDDQSDFQTKLVAWKKKDKTAEMCIVTSVTKDWVHIISESPTAAAYYFSLQDKFDRHNIISAYHLHSLMNAKMDNNQNIQDYLTSYDQT